MASRSLQQKLLQPILLATLLATVVISIFSYGLAKSNVESEWEARFDSIGSLVDRENIPLARSVLQLLANLTSAHWIPVGPDGDRLSVVSPVGGEETIAASSSTAWMELVDRLPEWAAGKSPPRLRLGERWFRGFRLSRKFPRAQPDGKAVVALVVLIDDSKPQQTIVQSIVLPILVGILAIAIMTAMTVWTTTRWAKRIGQLQKEVNAIAAGHFPTTVPSGDDDELSRLSQEMTRMSEQLSESWRKLRQLHGQQMLHNLSGGLAHNLRNTLTGARMAIELAINSADLSRSGSTPDPALTKLRLEVAIRQIEQAEGYLKRILLLAQGRASVGSRLSLALCIQTLQATLDTTATHRGKLLIWNSNESLDDYEVLDGETLVAAVSNLVWNGLEAGHEVTITAMIRPKTEASSDKLGVIIVADDGPGLSAEITESAFEPFVTTKPDGSGLGLAFVARAAQLLGGTANWRREGHQTIFELTFAVEVRS
ncbi:MAG: HAMP domain-containing histidine kinase [Planctomycetaceae bacterium]|nr:HAMP domain-containing histidine kinase [Planctomycetaceae bacterium]